MDLRAVSAAAIFWLAGAGVDAGRVQLIKRTEPAFDRYTNAPSPHVQNWLRQHFSRMVVFTPYFNERSRWYPSGLVYLDAYAVYRETTPLPRWILRDARGNRLYIDWGCNAATNTCPQYAADFGNPEFRAWWIAHAREVLARGHFRGLWIDDVNLEWRISDGSGHFVNPVDPRTGAPMTLVDWRRYMAEFMEQVRRELPDAELVHNSLWFAGGSDRTHNLEIRRQILAADLINIEHGVNDSGIKGGNGPWSLRALFSFIDHVNMLGRHVILEGIGGGRPGDNQALEYAVASYLLVNNGGDFLGDCKGAVTPETWWPGLGVDLGPALGGRYEWHGLVRRDFRGGVALVNEPGGNPVTARLDRPLRRVDGGEVAHLTLGPGKGAVLLE